MGWFETLGDLNHPFYSKNCKHYSDVIKRIDSYIQATVNMLMSNQLEKVFPALAQNIWFSYKKVNFGLFVLKLSTEKKQNRKKIFISTTDNPIRKS